MKVLISAHCAAPRFEGIQLLHAAGRLGLDVLLFDHPASRDPTLELPDICWRERPELLLLVSPEREDRKTLELIRSFGTRLVLWIPDASSRGHSPVRARRQWIAACCDRVYATTEETASRLRDVHGRAGTQLGRGYDLETLGASSDGDGDSLRSDGDFVTVRASDDPMVVRVSDGSASLRGFGDPDAFGNGVRVEDLAAGGFASAVKGHRYLTGGRPDTGCPGVFSAAAASSALGNQVWSVSPHLRLDDAKLLEESPGGAPFEERIATILADLEADSGEVGSA